MGNCCKVGSSSMEWGGEDWSYVTSKHNKKVFDEDHVNGLKKNVEKEKVMDLLRASSDANGKVKIMVSKKELKALLGENSKKHDSISGRHNNNASAEQVLVGLINANKDHLNHYHRPWRPVLQTIPEIN